MARRSDDLFEHGSTIGVFTQRNVLAQDPFLGALAVMLYRFPVAYHRMTAPRSSRSGLYLMSNQRYWPSCRRTAARSRRAGWPVTPRARSSATLAHVFRDERSAHETRWRAPPPLSDP